MGISSDDTRNPDVKCIFATVEIKKAVACPSMSEKPLSLSSTEEVLIAGLSFPDADRNPLRVSIYAGSTYVSVSIIHGFVIVTGYLFAAETGLLYTVIGIYHYEKLL